MKRWRGAPVSLEAVVFGYVQMLLHVLMLHLTSLCYFFKEQKLQVFKVWYNIEA